MMREQQKRFATAPLVMATARVSRRRVAVVAQVEVAAAEVAEEVAEGAAEVAAAEEEVADAAEEAGVAAEAAGEAGAGAPAEKTTTTRSRQCHQQHQEATRTTTPALMI